MKALNEFIKKFDLFGVSLTFKYKSKEKYTTFLGGIITLLFITLALVVGIFNFIPFYNRKKFYDYILYIKISRNRKDYF